MYRQKAKSDAMITKNTSRSSTFIVAHRRPSPRHNSNKLNWTPVRPGDTELAVEPTRDRLGVFGRAGIPPISTYGREGSRNPSVGSAQITPTVGMVVSFAFGSAAQEWA